MTAEIRTQFELVIDNQKLMGVLHLPICVQMPHAALVPYVIMSHGFGGTRTGRHRYMVLLSQALSQRGIASLRFDFRGAGDSEGDFCNQTVETQLEDILAVYKYTQTLPKLGASACGLFGRSFGGYLSTLIAPCIKPKAIGLSVPFAGQFTSSFTGPVTGSNQGLQVIKWSEVRSCYTFLGIPISHKLVEEVQTHPISQALVEIQNIPLLHIHAEKDVVVTQADLKVYQAGRVDAMALSDFVSFPHSDHEFSNYDERIESIQKVAQFFKNNL